MNPVLLRIASVAALLLAPWVSAQAGGPLPFTEEAVARGVNYTIEQFETFGTGLAFADLDNDGDPDLILLGRRSVGFASTIGLYENDGAGHFIDRGIGSGIPTYLPYASGVTAADYDDDGDLDVYLAMWLEPNVLLRNDGDFHFTDVAAAAGAAEEAAGGGCSWGDYDGDTWLDVYLPNRTGTNYPNNGPPSLVPNRLYRNRGDGTFEELAQTLGVDDGYAPSFQAAFFDIEHDGDVDLYLANDKGLSTGCRWWNHLWENLGGTFVDISQSSRTDACIDAMCIALGDFDANGFTDIYCTNLPLAGNPLFLNNGNRSFTEASEAAGVNDDEMSWGSVFFDYDNDGRLDLYVCNMWVGNRLYDNDGVWPVPDVAPALGVADAGLSFCVAVADIDLDGDLDIALSNLGEPVKLFVNHEGQQRSWVKFNLAGLGHNRFGVGARLEIRNGAAWQNRQVYAGHNYKTQDELTQHFGLGAQDFVDEIRVHWPGGAPTRSLRDYRARETWMLYPPQRLADADGDGVVDAGDFGLFLSCFTDSGRGLVDPGCEMMDLDGDADVDFDDFEAFVLRYSGPLVDCNNNTRLDLRDILTGESQDADGDAIPDECECLPDINNDGSVGLADLAVMLSNFGTTGTATPEQGDLDFDRDVDLADLSVLLSAFGSTCE